MSSTGQALGYVVGAVIGFYTGGASYVAMGAAIGGAIGSAIDPPKGPKIEGPRLSDLKQQTATYGANIPDIDGNLAVSGNVFWIENNQIKEVSHEESQGGKGGGGSTATTYAYYGTFAVGLCSVPVGEAKTLGRIWIGGQLFYDPTDPSIDAQLANGTPSQYFTFYDGSDTQLPDDRMQATLGVANVPAYRGLCYIVFKDLPLENYGNSIVMTQVKVEILSNVLITQYQHIVQIDDGVFPYFAYENGPVYPRISNGIFKCNHEDREYTIRSDGFLISNLESSSVDFSLIGLLNGKNVSFQGTGGVSGVTLGEFKVDGVTLFYKTGGTSNEFQGACVSNDGRRLYVCIYDGSTALFNVYDEDLNLISSQPQSWLGYVNNLSLPRVPGANIGFCVEDDGVNLWYVDIFEISGPVKHLTIDQSGATSVEHVFYTSIAGPNSSRFSMCAANGLMYLSSNGGTFSVFSRNAIVAQDYPTLGQIVQKKCLQSGLLSAVDLDVTALTQEVRGFGVSSQGSIRSAIDPLQGCWPFDVVPSGYKIKFVPRGGSSVVTVDATELDARDSGNAPGVRIAHSREMDSQLPRRIEVTYLDSDREYDVGPAGIAERLNTDAINVEALSFPIVLNATEAAGKAQTLLYLRWIERNDVSFIAPPTRLNLEPADIVTVTTSTETYSLRLTGINYLPDGRLECSAKFNSAGIYSPNAVAQPGLSTGSSLTFSGDSRVALLDIPVVNSVMDAPGIAVAMTGYYDGWQGGTLFKSDDDWQSWAPIEGFPAPGANIGTAANALATGRTDVKDVSNILYAYIPNSTLSSVTDLQMWNGSNHFALGAHGRWEIIAAKTITALEDGSYSLSELMRGRFGTESSMSLHQAGDMLIHLDISKVEFVGLPISAINVEKDYRAVSKGQLLDAAENHLFTYSGANLKPLPSAYVKGHRDQSTLDWTITGTRRTRTPVEPFSGIAQPLGETSEAYAVEIWTSGYSEFKRSISVVSGTDATYTAAQQIEDFGDVMPTIYIDRKQISSVIGNGFSSRATLINNIGSDPYIAYVVSLLHMNGANNSTTFYDVFGVDATVYGDAKISTASSKFGGASGNFAGTGYISMPDATRFNFGSGDWTIRGWVNTSTASCNIWGKRTGVTWAPVSLIINAGVVNLRCSTSGSSWNADISSTATVNNSAWNFIEVCRHGSSLYIFVNGTKQAAVGTVSGALMTNSSPVYMGANSDASGAMTGYFDDWQVTKGIARNTASYSIPVAQFPDV